MAGIEKLNKSPPTPFSKKRGEKFNRLFYNYPPLRRIFLVYNKFNMKKGRRYESAPVDSLESRQVYAGMPVSRLVELVVVTPARIIDSAIDLGVRKILQGRRKKK